MSREEYLRSLYWWQWLQKVGESCCLSLKMGIPNLVSSNFSIMKEFVLVQPQVAKKAKLQEFRTSGSSTETKKMQNHWFIKENR